MYCPSCEVNYPDEMKECVNCSTELLAGIVCRDCGTRNAHDAAVCNLCGTVFKRERPLLSGLKSSRPKSPLELSGMAKVCKHGHVNGTGNIFCSECGCSLVHIDREKAPAETPRKGLFAALLGALTGG